MNKQVTSKRTSIVPDFGGKGWFLIIVLMFIMFFGLGLQSEGMNVIHPGYEALYGWSKAELQMLNSYAGWFGVLGTFLWGLLSTKIGGKKVMNISLLLYAIFVILWGQATSMPMYTATLFGVYFCLNGAMGIGLSNLVANWFPLKKGNVMGWVTIGASLSPMFAIPFFTFLTNTFGFRNFFLAVGILVLVLWVLTMLIKNHPEEAGAYPDNDKNMTPEQAKQILAIAEEYKKTSPFTFGRLLKTKQMWFTAVGCGILLLVPLGFMSSLVARMGSIGVDVPTTIGLISAGGVVNLFFSLITGFVDTKFGTKNATYMCYALYFVGIILTCFMQSLPLVFIGAFIIISVSGGVNNLTTSMAVSIFGRFDFAKAFAILSPVSVCTRTLGYMLVQPIVALSGGDYVISNVVLMVAMVIGILLIKFNDIRPIGRTEEDFEAEAAKRATATK